MSKKNMDMFKLNPVRILVLGFAIVIFFGAILLNLSISSKNGESIGFINALFTSTSAVCVTGLAIVDTGTYWTVFGQVVILLLIQIGGLGFKTMMTLMSLILGKRIMLKHRLVLQESLNHLTIAGIVRNANFVYFLCILNWL